MRKKTSTITNCNLANSDNFSREGMVMITHTHIQMEQWKLRLIRSQSLHTFCVVDYMRNTFSMSAFTDETLLHLIYLMNRINIYPTLIQTHCKMRTWSIVLIDIHLRYGIFFSKFMIHHNAIHQNSKIIQPNIRILEQHQFNIYTKSSLNYQKSLIQIQKWNSLENIVKMANIWVPQNVWLSPNQCETAQVMYRQNQ